MDAILPQPSTRRSGAVLSDIVHARMTGQIKDLLLLAIDTGIHYGQGLPLERHPDPVIDALMQDLLALWHDADAAARALAGDPDAQPPAWLREQQELSEQVIGGRT